MEEKGGQKEEQKAFVGSYSKMERVERAEESKGRELKVNLEKAQLHTKATEHKVAGKGQAGKKDLKEESYE